jgi:UDP-N-acetyl-D-glucosamine dehydrogenase
LCLPTPLKNNKPDLSHITSVVKKMYSYIVPGQLIILESTSYPGTTKQTIVRKLKKFDIGKNYFVGYSPEREDPGTKKFIFKNIPKIISGYSKNCQQITNILYKSIVKKTVKSKNIEIAETAKIYENIYRAVNIALVNEMRFFLKKINININDVIDLAKTKPFGFSEFRPGPGVGGHCIPIDPLYLSWIAKKNNFKTRFIELASKTNIKTTQKIQKLIQDIIEKKKIKKVLIIGLAYKKNIEDKRESASIKIYEFLSKKNIKINFFDRFVKNVKINEKKINSIKYLNLKKLKIYDLIIVATDHDDIDYSSIIKNSKLVIDLRNRYKKNYDNLIKI